LWAHVQLFNDDIYDTKIIFAPSPVSPNLHSVQCALSHLYIVQIEINLGRCNQIDVIDIDQSINALSAV
jgi:hypothetical protein